VLLSALLWWVDSVARARGYHRPGLVTGCFLVGYAIIRFSLEFTRAPDAQLGLVIGGFSMGQLLSMIMFAVGAALLAVVATRRAPSAQNPNLLG
jgi:phosphatidylglycerol:prolipoprotein diacylglycerol transferase